MRGVLDSAEKKLTDMCHKQSNKLEIAYKSMMKALEAKKKEFLNIIRDFYTDQKQKVNFDKQRAANFLTKVKSMHQEDLQKLESSLEETPYEELFKTLSTKSQDLA